MEEDTKDYMFYDFICLTLKNKKKFVCDNRNHNSGFAYKGGKINPFGTLDTFYALIWVVVTHRFIDMKKFIKLCNICIFTIVMTKKKALRDQKFKYHIVK